jgi:hypothetical protein
MRPYWVIRNKTEEDVPLNITLWSGQEVDDVFHANEVAIIRNPDILWIFRHIDPLEEVFSIEQRIEEVEKVDWQKEGF